MASVKLTARSIEAIKLPAGKTELVVYDSEVGGFGLRIREGGSRTFIYQYRVGKQNRRITLGAAVKEAFPGIRGRVLELQAKVRLGIDPAGEKQLSIRIDKLTFGAVANRYLAQHLKAVRSATYTETERYLLKVAKTLHKSAPMADITRRDIAQVLSVAAEERGDVSANRLRTALSAMFAWAMREGLVEANPTTGTNVRAEKAKDRVLSIDELVSVWKALENDTFGDIAKLLMLTGQRRSEIGDLRWEEISETAITLPKHRTKNGQEHIVPLSEPARVILSRQYHIVGHACVFAVRSDVGFTAYDRGKKALDAKLPDMAPWTLHDLRRSVATHLAERCGVLPHVIEACLNHVSGHKAGVAGIYNRATYLKEKTEALVMWGEYLTAAVSGGNAKIVTLRTIA